MTPPRLAAVAVLSAVLALSGQPALAAPATVNLPAKAPAQRAVDLREVWRLGGDDDEDVLLGMVPAAALGPDGNVYLVDRQMAQVLVIAPDGSLVRTLGRPGDGPGELRMPSGLLFLPDGRLAVVAATAGNVTLLNTDGTPAGEIRTGGEASEGGFNFMRGLRAGGGKLVGVRGRGTFNPETRKMSQVTTMSIMDLAGKDQVKLFERTTESDMQRRVFDEAAEFSELNTWNVSGDGTIYSVPEREAWAINARGPDGEVRATFRRPFTPRKRSAAEKSALTDGMFAVINGRRQEIESKALDTDPAIERINVGADGKLYVTNCLQSREQLPAGVAARYDVITPDGRFVEELSLRVPGFNNQQDLVLFLDGRTFVIVRNFDQAREAAMAGLGHGGDQDEKPAAEAEPLEVVCYRLP